MGILTGVVSAIRVRRTPSLRAFIGKAQEGAGNTEASYISRQAMVCVSSIKVGIITRVFHRKSQTQREGVGKRRKRA
jgi:hypothetical protein